VRERGRERERAKVEKCGGGVLLGKCFEKEWSFVL